MCDCLDKISGMKPFTHLVLGTAVGVCLVGAASVAADWPNWRGPNANGVAPDGTLPIKWSATENVAWKAPIAGAGVSTPIVSGDRVYRHLADRRRHQARGQPSPPRAGRRRRGPGREGAQRRGGGADPSKTFFVVEAFGRADGKRIWERRIEAIGDLTPVHDKHNLATPSPVTDGALVFAWFGTGQLVALDRTGAWSWQRHLAKGERRVRHSVGTRQLAGALRRSADPPLRPAGRSYLLALDKKTGKDRWKADRGQGRSSYSTPLVIEGAFGAEVIVNSTERIDAYDAKTGAFLWHTGESEPLCGADTGLSRRRHLRQPRDIAAGPTWRSNPAGRGDVTSTQTVWRIATGAPYCSSLLYYDRVVYMANDVGVLTAVDSATGERVWQERVDGVFSASPVGGGGHVVLRQRERRDRRAEGRPRAAGRSQKRARRARRRLARDLKRANLHPNRRARFCDRNEAVRRDASLLKV